MKRYVFFVLMMGIVAAGIGCVSAEEKAKGDAAVKLATPQVIGKWTGLWGAYVPAKSAMMDKEHCKVLDCSVEVKDGVWTAVFEGECGRPYKYKITMEGRQAGPVVLFKGTTDLGEKDGGVYDWIGRADDNEFVGFYTSSHHVGVFQLKRKE